MKLCSKCELDLPATSFAANAAKPDGLQTYCRSCTAQIKSGARARRTTQQRKAYNAYAAAWRRARYRSDPSYRERVLSANDTRRRAAGFDAEYSTILRLDPCAYCGARMDHVDHIVPVVRGGTGEFTNLTASCMPCNTSKRERSLLHFMLEVN